MDTSFLEQYIVEIKLHKKKIKAYGSYPFNLNALKNLETLSMPTNVTFIIGENGSGKSTLLETRATSYGFNPKGGSKNFNFHTKASHSSLYQYLTI